MSDSDQPRARGTSITITDLFRTDAAVEKAIEIIPDVMRVGLDCWKTKRDGTFFQQQGHLASLHEKAAQAAHQRDIDQARLNAELRSGEREHAQRLAMARDWYRAQVRVRHQAETEQRALKLANSPFTLSSQDVRHYVEQATQGGEIPALLIAPFFQDTLGRQDNDEGPSRFLLALRRTWDRMPWQADLIPLAGPIGRPLRNLDLDVRVIWETLHDLPVVLAHGAVQAGSRVLLELCAWNMLGEAAKGSMIRLSVPGLTLPQPEDASGTVAPDAALAFEDGIGEFCGILLGALGDWFHLTSHGRTPLLHRLLPEQMLTERRIVANSAASMYGLAVKNGRMNTVAAMVGQAELYAETGQTERAQEAGSSALAAVHAEPETAYTDPELLIRLGRVFEAIGDGETQHSLWSWYVKTVWR